MIKKWKDGIKAGAFVTSILHKAAPAFCLLYPAIKVLLSLLPSLEASLTGMVIDRFQSAIKSGQFSSGGNSGAIFGSGTGYIWLPVILLLSIAAVQELMTQASLSLQNFIRLRSDKYLVGGILRKLSRLKLQYFENNAMQDAINVALKSDFAVTRCYLVTVDIVCGFVKFLSLAVVLFGYYPLVALAYLLLTLPDILVTASKNKQMDQFSIDSMPKTRKKDYYYSILTEKKYAKDIRVWNLFDIFRGRFNSTWKEILKEREILFVHNLRIQLFTVLISIVGYGGLFAFLIWKTGTGEMTIGGLSACTVAVMSIASCFRLLSNNIFNYTSLFIPRVKKLQDFYSWEEESQGTDEVGTAECLEFRHVSFRYPGTETPILQDLNFCIGVGEKIALVGVNGAGKTTIVKLILRLYEPDEGQILYGGKDIRDFDLASWRHLFGVCFQETADYAMTYGENIAMGEVTSENQEEIRRAALTAGLAENETDLPDLQTQMLRVFTSDGMELSGGQWQKMAVARAYFRKSSFLILDEPSSKLDAKAEERVFTSFSELSRGRSGLLISHRLSNMMSVTRILVIEQGKIIEQGTHQELMKMNGNYAAMYRLQADSYKV